jgi:hypothetical protein
MSTPVSAAAGRDTNILQDYLRELSPRRMIRTVFRLCFSHKRFYDDVFAGRWAGITEPIPFWLTCVSIFLLLRSLAPQVDSMTWDAGFSNLTADEQQQFLEAFAAGSSAATDLSAIETHIRDAIPAAGLVITVEEVLPFLESQGYPNLALRLENFQLRTASTIDQFVELSLEIFGGIGLLLFGWLLHRELKVENRSAKQTIQVYMYCYGLNLLLTIPYLFMMPGELNYILAYVILAIIGAYMFYASFRYTHGVGFRRLMWAGTKAAMKPGLVIGVIAVVAAVVFATDQAPATPPVVQQTAAEQPVFAGVQGSLRVAFDWLGTRYVAITLLDGSHGSAVVSYYDGRVGAEVAVEQDLTLAENAGFYYYVGANPRSVGSRAPHPTYASDVFRLKQLDENIWTVDAVCDAEGVCVAAEVTAIN